MRLLIAWIVPVLAASAASAQAPPPKPSSFGFPSDSLSFGNGTLDFPTSSFGFPSTLTQTETASTIEVELPADILFDFDKADIRPEAATALHEVGLLLREKARGSITINGHTDAMGSDSYNQRLSERRAASVRAWLKTRENLGSAKFTIAGFGAKAPVAPNRNTDGSDNPEGRQRNRRVTLIFPK